jgi:hypothetical protein
MQATELCGRGFPDHMKQKFRATARPTYLFVFL